MNAHTSTIINSQLIFFHLHLRSLNSFLIFMENLDLLFIINISLCILKERLFKNLTTIIVSLFFEIYFSCLQLYSGTRIC